MDRLFFDIIDKAADCQHLANALAKNANYNGKYGDVVSPILPDLYKQISDCQQALFRAVGKQCSGEPWDTRQ